MKFFKTWEESRKILEKGRLVWYSGSSTAERWTEHWNKHDIYNALRGAQEKNYPYKKLLLRYLSKDKPILEGGCGRGDIVLGLQKDGYRTVGVDWSQDTVKISKQIVHDIDVIGGDVLNLPFPRGCFGGYVSIGVVEHFFDGPEKALAEANRVLCKGGVLFISVPYFNPLRQFKAKVNLFPNPAREINLQDFYQYAFTEKEITQLLYQSGFRVCFVEYINIAIGIGREMGIVGQKMRKWRVTAKFISLGEKFRFFRHILAHSIILVCKKI